jgi:hypothetical protein
VDDIFGTTGTVADFVVVRVVTVAKEAFPTRDVYGPFTRPVLRLVTCGGVFDRMRHRYRSNVVVYAEPD